MRWVLLLVLGFMLIAGEKGLCAENPADLSLSGPTFKAGALKFIVPSRWQSEPIENTSSRAGQWHIPLPHGEEGEGGEAIAFYFGPGLGDSTKDNIEAWATTMSRPDGHSIVPDVKSRTVNGIKMTTATFFGTYSQSVSLPGLPPVTKPNYGLLGAVVENPQGNIYWRFTGPESLFTATLPLFDKILDSVKPQDK